MDEEFIRGKESILLIDDEEMIIEVGRQMLKMLGYTVFIANSGKEAIGVYQKQRNHIDIIILDMVMPDLGGKAVYEKLKKINPDVKVLLSSGYGMDGQVADILNCGCDGFIQKPFNLKGLSLKVREVLDRKPSDGDLPRFQ